MATISPGSFQISHNNNVSGSTYNNGTGTLTMTFTSITQNIENNTSTINFKVRGTNSGGYYLYGYAWWYSVDGGNTWTLIKDYHSSSTAVKQSAYDVDAWQTGSITITHNINGTSPDFRIKMRELYRWGANDTRWAMTDGGNGRLYNAYEASSGTITLSTIPRYVKVLSLSGKSTYNAATMPNTGTTVSISLSNPAGFYSKVKANIGGSTLWQWDCNNTTTSISFTPDKANIITAYRQGSTFAPEKSGTSDELAIDFSVESYSDSAYQTLIGTTSYSGGNAAISITNAEPTATFNEVLDTATHSGTAILYRKTSITNTPTVNSKLDSAAKTRLYVNDVLQSGLGAFTLPNMTIGTYIVKLINHRGIAKTYTFTHNVINYIEPTVLPVYGFRKPITLDEVFVKCGGSFYQGSLGLSTNTVAAQYKVWGEDETEPSSWSNFTITTDTDARYETNEATKSSSYMKNVNFKIKINDLITTIEINGQIIAENPIIAISKEEVDVNKAFRTNSDTFLASAAVGKFSEDDDYAFYINEYGLRGWNSAIYVKDYQTSSIPEDISVSSETGPASIETIMLKDNGLGSVLYLEYTLGSAVAAGNIIYQANINVDPEFVSFGVGFINNNMYCGCVEYGKITIRAINAQTASNDTRYLTIVFNAM